MAATDAKPQPQKNVAQRITFEIYNVTNGALISGATALDSEVSKDGAAFNDCTAEATEIGSSGVYTLDLTATEMNADTVAVVVKTTSANAKIPVIVMYPQETGDVKVDVDSWKGAAPASLISQKVSAVASTIADDAITAAALADSAVAELAIPTAAENTTDLLDTTDGVESGMTVRQALRVMLAALAGVSSVSGGNRIYRDTANAKDRITATVLNGDRTVVVLDKS